MADVVERVIGYILETDPFGDRFSANDISQLGLLREHVNQLEAKLHCMCGDTIDHSPWSGHSPVSMFDYAVEQEVQQRDSALRDLVQTLLDNDPNEPIADNGMTVLDGWRERARHLTHTAGQGQDGNR